MFLERVICKYGQQARLRSKNTSIPNPRWDIEKERVLRRLSEHTPQYFSETTEGKNRNYGGFGFKRLKLSQTLKVGSCNEGQSPVILPPK